MTLNVLALRRYTISAATKKHILESFQEFDEGSKGWLSKSDLKCAMLSLFGRKPTKDEVEQLMQPCDYQLDFGAFQTAMEEKLSLLEPGDRIRQIFKAFDKRCFGFIGREDLHAVFHDCLPHIKSSVIDEIFDEVDTDGDGRVSCREFELLMCGK
eukprot:CAMPEP_0196581250 /NCGR_PEP_ID=MMETSP1081-20130531/33183_1 /TAXON_ID=36882 /ORGANISM="Pyramimonas amylifera, Strain CCMP720" /LENGTH=154 /DNA_ID=CAMNT_0041901407 /DNA_START=72 /DNA_END=533 /DNA_ORIENTATION=+